MKVVVQEAPLDEGVARAAVQRDHHGAVLVFHGVVRNHHDGKAVTHIDYQAYRSMAEKELLAVTEECVERFGIPDIAVFHRVGPVRVGEASLLVAVADAHRRFVFDAAAWLLEELKRRVPIWKKEFGPDGAHWVEGVRPPEPQNSPSERRSPS